MPTGDIKMFERMKAAEDRGDRSAFVVYDISQNYDGVWRAIPPKNFYRACCDCGLVHREEYRVKNGKVEYRVWRDKKETKRERRRLTR